MAVGPSSIPDPSNMIPVHELTADEIPVLSAGVNKRTDCCGGSISNRARIVCEIIRGIKEPWDRFNGIYSLIPLISDGPHAHSERSSPCLHNTASNLTDNTRSV